MKHVMVANYGLHTLIFFIHTYTTTHCENNEFELHIV